MVMEEAMTSCHKGQISVALLIFSAAIVFCSIPLSLHAQERGPLVFSFDGPVRGTVSVAGIGEFPGIPSGARTQISGPIVQRAD
jgi:hypothetical protein